MNSLNALGFLALGSLMNAIPALAPAIVSRGATFDGLSTSAIWLHLMGIVVGTLGSSVLIQEAIAHYRFAASAARTARALAPQAAGQSVPNSGSLRVAA